MLLWAKPEKAGPQKVHLGFSEDPLGGSGINKKSGLSTEFGLCITVFWTSLPDGTRLSVFDVKQECSYPFCKE